MRNAGARAAVLAAVALLAYAGSVQGGFAYDDPFAIQANPVVTGEASLVEAFARDYWGRPAERTNGSWRPVALLSLGLDGRVGAGSPLPFHLANVLLHAAVVAATYLAWRRVAGETAAVAGALLLAVLAAPSEAVQGIVGRADLLATLFGTIGLAAHRMPGRAAAAFAAGCLALALGSKESAAAVPLAWVALDLLAPADSPPARRAGRWALYALAIATWAAGRHLALGSFVAVSIDPIGNPLLDAALPGRVLGAAATLAHPYLTGLVVPTRRLYDCSAAECGPAGPGDPLAWAGIALVAAVVAAPFLLRRRAPGAAAAIAWAGMLMLPASNLLFLGPTVYGERLLYATAPGICVAAAAGTAALARRLPRPGIAWTGFAVLALANAAAVQARHPDWSSSDALFEAGVEAAPRSAKAQYNAAWAAFERGDLALASVRAREAARLHADYPEAHALLGGVLDVTGRTAEADAAFTVALSAARARGAPPSDLVLHHATFLARHGRYAEALAGVSAQRAIDPENPRLADLEARVRARTERR